MKKQNDVLNIIITFIAGIAVICAAFFARDLVKIHRAATRKPILKVMSMIPGGWITPWKEIYYIVYDNGDYEETEEFQLADIEIYNLYSVEDIETDLEGMPEYSKNIIDYVNNLKNGNIYNLYLVDNRCFFDIHDSRTLQNEYTSTVFEYFPESKSVEKLVQFKKNYTRHVEPY